MAGATHVVDSHRMTETQDQTEEERRLERRQERQGWLLLIGGFALAGCLVIAASFL
jgi:hypothetical protein